MGTVRNTNTDCKANQNFGTCERGLALSRKKLKFDNLDSSHIQVIESYETIKLSGF